MLYVDSENKILINLCPIQNDNPVTVNKFEFTGKLFTILTCAVTATESTWSNMSPPP